MIILKLTMDNILSFNDFSINFTYPRKIKSLINSEHLETIPSFRYKKVNIFVGSNATGKTSLCTVIWKIIAFLNFKEKNLIDKLVTDAKKDGHIEVDFVDNKEVDYAFYRMKIQICAIDENDNASVRISNVKIVLKNGDTYESICKSIDRIEAPYLDYLEVLKSLNIKTGFNVILQDNDTIFNKVDFIKSDDKDDIRKYEKILNSVFKTLDPSIESIKQSQESDDAYVIKHQNGKTIIIQNGCSLFDIPYLSSGTKYGFNIANMLYSIGKHDYGTYVIDEQFSYVNSDIEVAVLSTMISLLGATEQLFFTTHNSNILSMGLPFHSFYFMKKKLIGDKLIIMVTCGSEKENRNNVSPKNLYDNDAFATAPILDLILDLGGENAT